jgi:hypothetical protein
MTEIHNASLAAGASSADLTVSPLEPHGVNAAVDAQVFSKNASTGVLYGLASVAAGSAVIVYPTTATLVVKNATSAAGVVQVTAK